MALSRNNSWCAPGSNEAAARMPTMLVGGNWRYMTVQDRFDFLNALSRKRALTTAESHGLETAMKKLGML